MLELAEHGGGMLGILHFNTDLFDKATAHRMLAHYVVSCTLNLQITFDALLKGMPEFPLRAQVCRSCSLTHLLQ